MLELVRKLVQALDNAGVRYVHFKSNEHIDQSVEGKTDFDILVDRHASRVFETVLLELDFKRFVSPPRATYPGVDDWLGMDPDTGCFLHLHTHYQLITGQAGYKDFVLPWTEAALNSRVRDGETGLYFVSPEFELIELYTRIIAKARISKDLRARRKGYSLKGETLREAKWLWERIDEEKLTAMKQECFGELAEGIEDSLFRKESFTPAEYRSFRKQMLEKLTLHSRAGMTAVGLRSLFYIYTAKIKGKLRKRRFLPGYQRKKYSHTGGLLIAFLGVDGSGKTTVTSEIHSWLSWKIECSHMSLGYGRNKRSLSVRLRGFLHRLFRGKTPDNGLNRSSHQYILSFTRSIRRDIRRIHSYCLNGGIMVVDRYPQLQFPGAADGPKASDSFPEYQRKELENLSIVREIEPDLVFKLMLPVEISKQRRPEDSMESLQRKYDILKELQYPNSVVVEVDATQPLEQELLFIKKKIWEQL